MNESSADPQSRDPMHGVTLAMIVEYLVDKLGWEELGRLIKIRCFVNDPSIKSSLQFLRRTPWAREKVEELYFIHRFQKSDQENDRQQ